MNARRLIAAILSVSFLLALVPAASFAAGEKAMPFSDVRETDWFYSYVKYVYENEMMVGISDNKFEPNGKLTRGMFVTILCRIDGGETEITNSFKDVPANAWFAPYVGWAAKTGLVNGYPGGVFKPDAYLSRQEMAAITDRYIKYAGIRMPRRFTAPAEFSDNAVIADWAKENMEDLRRAGIFNGDTAGNCNPASNMTRAEAATVIKNLIDAGGLAWQGYDPAYSDGAVIFGAKYLYCNASQVRGTLGTDTGNVGDVPVLSAFYDIVTAGNDYDWVVPGYGGRNPYNSVGISVTGINFDIFSLPVMKIAYTYADYDEPEALSGAYRHNFDEEYGTNHKHCEYFDFTAGDPDGDFKTASYDFTSLLTADTFAWAYDILNLLVIPFASDYKGTDGRFNIAYIGFFPDQESADVFTVSSASESVRDYIFNYFLYSELDWRDADSATLEGYDSLLTDRISEIMNSKSEITPDDIKKSGGKVYYVSSFRGDDSNDGLTPDTPFRSLKSLFRYRVGIIVGSKLEPGDGVFFERGSIFYPEFYGQHQVMTLFTCNGVTYGAYGMGPKPQFTHALDFGAVRSDQGETGTWLPTEWENVWLLDDDVNYWSLDDGERGEEGSCGNIVINHGEYVGIRMFSKGSSSNGLFNSENTSVYLGYMCNGKEWFESGGTPMTNPGTVLTHNLEYIHDPYEHKLYMYCDKGNPGVVFADIKCATDGWTVTGYMEEKHPEAKACRLDNISILYSGTMGLMLGGDGFLMTNCEIGWCSGSLSSVESGKETNGGGINETVRDCYLHDIGDGPLSTQHAVNWTPGSAPINYENFEYYNNVIVSSGNAIESLCYNETQRDETGIYGKNKMINFHVHDNIFAYIGYGITNQQDPGIKSTLNVDGTKISGGVMKGGEVFCSTGEKINSVVENNLILYPCGTIWSTDTSTDATRRGWISRNNTYVCDSRYVMYDKHESCMDHFVLNEPITKFNGQHMPYNERYLSFFTSKGMDEGSTFYHYESTDFNFAFRAPFTDDYYIRRGIKPVNP